MTRYLIDSNILITSFRSTYPMDIFTAFWEKILEQFCLGNILLIDRVHDELIAGDDILKDWIIENEQDITVLCSDDVNIISEYSEIMQQVMDDDGYSLAAKEEFADVADSWLIAHAKCNDYIIVTEETYQRNIRRKVKIPNECIRNNVDFIKTVDLLRNLGIRI